MSDAEQMDAAAIAAIANNPAVIAAADTVKSAILRGEKTTKTLASAIIAAGAVFSTSDGAALMVRLILSGRGLDRKSMETRQSQLRYDYFVRSTATAICEALNIEAPDTKEWELADYIRRVRDTLKAHEVPANTIAAVVKASGVTLAD
jgi:hypothetical protein